MHASPRLYFRPASNRRIVLVCDGLVYAALPRRLIRDPEKPVLRCCLPAWLCLLAHARAAVVEGVGSYVRACTGCQLFFSSRPSLRSPSLLSDELHAHWTMQYSAVLSFRLQSSPPHPFKQSAASPATPSPATPSPATPATAPQPATPTHHTTASQPETLLRPRMALEELRDAGRRESARASRRHRC